MVEETQQHNLLFVTLILVRFSKGECEDRTLRSGITTGVEIMIRASQEQKKTRVRHFGPRREIKHLESPEAIPHLNFWHLDLRTHPPLP